MLEFTGGRTNIADALRLLRTQAFTAANGDREFDVPNYAFLITDGEATVNQNMTLPEAIETRIAGIHIVAIGPEMNRLVRIKYTDQKDPTNTYIKDLQIVKGLSRDWNGQHSNLLALKDEHLSPIKLNRI